MRRVLLPVSMVLSLWPAGVVAVSVVNAATAPKRASVSSTTTTISVPSQARADYGTLNRLGQREVLLLSRLHASSALRGVADQRLARDAQKLKHDDFSWINSNAGLDARAQRVAQHEATVANRMALFAARPSQSLLDGLNRAVAAYDATIRSH